MAVICRSNRRAPGSLTASLAGAPDPVDGPLRPTARLSAIDRQKYARDKPTVSPSGRSFATSTRATGARLKLCQAQAVGRFASAEAALEQARNFDRAGQEAQCMDAIARAKQFAR
jgi:hypothetical protein